MSYSTDDTEGAGRLARIALKTGVELQYAERGTSTKPAILFLHGYADSWHSFGRIFALLSGGCHCMAPDLRGHGDSDKPLGPYSLDVYTEDLVAFMDALELERTSLVGHSMGSFIAQSLAARCPRRVERLVLISSAASTTGNEILAQIQPAIDALCDPVDREFVIEFQTPSNPVPNAFMQDIVAESLKVPAHVWKAVFSGLLHVDNRPILHQISVPTLILWGNQDALFIRKDQDDLLERIPNSRLIEYSAGHALHWEKPDEAAADLKNFLSPPSRP